MTNSRYELLMLAVPEITQDELADLEKQIVDLIKERKGTLLSFERWCKLQLADPVRKHEYGVYILMRFEVPHAQGLNEEIRSFLRIKFDTIIMRNLLSALEGDSLEYKRPRSLEEAPVSENGSLLKSKRVEGLISAVDSQRTRKDGVLAAPPELEAMAEDESHDEMDATV